MMWHWLFTGLGVVIALLTPLPVAWVLWCYCTAERFQRSESAGPRGGNVWSG